MGERENGYEPIWVGWGEGVIDADVALLYDRRAEARTLAHTSNQMSAEATRCRLVLAEADLRDGLLGTAAAQLDAAEPWVQRSGSVEHLILLLSARMRLAEAQGNQLAADACYNEALHLARRCKFGLYHIDLVNQHAAALLDRHSQANVMEARRLAMAALFGLTAGDEAVPAASDSPIDHLLVFGALHPRCRYAWGEAAARVVLARCALVAAALPDAREQLVRAESIYARLKAPQLPETHRLLRVADEM